MDSKGKIAGTLIGALVLGYFGGGLGAWTVSYFDQDQTSAQPEQASQELVVEETSQTIEAINKVKPAVVSIIATKDLQIIRRSPFLNSPFAPFFQPEIPESDVETRRQQVGGGSGFIIQEDGLALTNRHVVLDDQADYRVVLSDGREFPAEVVSRDPANDLAVIQLYQDDERSAKAQDLPIVEFGDSTGLKVGQRVIAIGNALGEFQNTVTTGIISADSRQIEAADPVGGNRDVLTNLLQTDAAINQGNSGGPLVNLAGQVIGVNTAIANRANGIGFAIPVSDVRPVIASVKEFGEIIRPQLGVRYLLLSPAKADELQLPIDQGALLVGDETAGLFAVIPGSPADQAGLQVRDVIVEVDGQQLNQDFGLRQAIRNKKPGDIVELTIWRSGETLTKEVELEAFNQNNNE